MVSINHCSQCHPAAAPLHRASSELVFEIQPIVMKKQRVDVWEGVNDVEVFSVGHAQTASASTTPIVADRIVCPRVCAPVRDASA